MHEYLMKELRDAAKVEGKGTMGKLLNAAADAIERLEERSKSPKEGEVG